MKAIKLKKILVVDDEVYMIKLLRHFLEKKYEVFTCASGEEALIIIGKEDSTPDLVISDMLMPGGMTGLELSHKVKSAIPSIPIIIMTGTPGIIPPGHNVEAVFEKPFNLNELLKKIQGLIG